MEMPRLKLGENGPSLSRLVYGTWRLNEDPEGVSPERIRSKIETCLEHGITTLDLADIYGGYTCEETVGKCLKQNPGLRDQIELISKCDINAPCEAKPDVKVKHYDASADNIIRCVENALNCLGVDYLDILLIHRPDFFTPAEETAKGLNKLIQEGKILFAGVSNYNIHQFDLLNRCMEKPLVTNQIELSLLHMDSIYNGTLEQCQKVEIHPMAWSPLGGGRLFSPKEEAGVRLRKEMEIMADKYGGATVDQLAYAWIMALPSQPLPVLGTNQIERIESAAKSASIVLDRQDWFKLWEAAKGYEVP